MSDLISVSRDLARNGATEQALELLERASTAGDTAASTELGLWYIRGDVLPRDLAKARKHLRRAARAGGEEALLLEVALSANGSGGPVDWASSLSLLRQGAERFNYLKKELRLVESLNIDERGYPYQRPQGSVIDERVGLTRYPGFLSQSERQHIANIALSTLSPSTVFDPTTGHQVQNTIRTSDGTVIGPTQEDLVFQAIFRRIAKATDTDPEQGEPLSVLRYGPGQQYKPHFDAIAGARNNRIKTVLMYLNDAFEGGATTFPGLEITVQPKAGDAIVFDGLQDDGRLNDLSRHAGLPVTRGVKWVATRWIRALPFDPWSDQAAD